jgi:membrane protein implicated in regulation of membrane protease activity
MLQKYLKKRGWSALIVVRYALLQLPAIALLVLALIFVQRWVTIPAWVFWGSITLWIAKDVILFPFVWRAYDWDHSGSENSLVGEPGIVQDRLTPFGYIRVRGELWQAEVLGGSPPIDKGKKVWVQGMRGLTLLVQPDNEENNVKKNG